MTVKIRDNKKQWEKFKKEMEKVKKKPHVAVGVLSKEGTGKYKDGTVTIADVASWNEFGTDKIPARSFLRSVFDEDNIKFLAIMRRLRNQWASGKKSTKQVLSIVGEYAQAQVQKRITEGGKPFIPNALRTLEWKFPKTSPLINTGQLRQSIRYEVRMAESKSEEFNGN